METEVICISSDDESDSQKENKKKKSLVTFVEDGSHAYTKIEVLSSEEDGVQGHNLKRKKLHVNKEGKPACSMEKKIKLRKLSTDQNMPEVDKDDSAIPSQVNGDQEMAIEKPKLIVKERKKISYVAHDIFSLFINLCLQKIHTSDVNMNEMNIIVGKLKKRYEELDPVYVKSENFALFLNEKREAIMNDDKRLYVHIQEVMNEMKKRIKRQSRTSRNNESYDAIPSTSYATSNSSVNNVAELDSENNNEDMEEAVNYEKRKKIKLIIKAMKNCECMIKMLEKAEVNFEDEGDSNYIKVERYKQKIIELYSKLCKLTGENADAGRAYLRPKYISTTRLVVVDQAITNFINSKISKRNRLKRAGTFTDDLIFPDYRDILECVNRCNEKKNLGLDETRQKQMAEKAFVELGEYLQRARRNDYWDTFSLYLENTEEDPALKDRELASKLADNRSEGEKRLAAVFEKYAKKQEEMKAQFVDNETSTGEENEEENSMDDANESNDNLSVNNVSDDDISEKDVEMIKENKSEQTEKDKSNNISMVNMDRNVDKVNSSKAKTDTLPERCNKNVEIIASARENNVPDNEKKSVEDGRTCGPATNRTVIVTAKSVIGIKAQEDSLPTSTTDIVNRTEDDVAEKVKEGVSKVINSTTETKADVEAEIMEVIEVVMQDVSSQMITNPGTEIKVSDEEVITGNMKEMMVEDVREVIMKDMTEIVTEKEATEVVASENVSSEKQQEEEKKPLLRVRSFAKPPTTWEDGRHKAERAAQENNPKITNQTKDVIDLTNESSANKPAPVVAKCAIQLGDKVVPVVKAKRQTLVIPSGSNIISVQNITNNYLKIDRRTGQIIAPMNDIRGSTIIRMPSTAQTATTATVRQNQPQSTNAATAKNEMPAKRKETILRIIQPSKAIIVAKKSTGQAITKPLNMHSPLRHK